MSEGTPPSHRPPRRQAAVAASVGFLVLALFQLTLALGAPLGRAAWGGNYERLPTPFRIGSAISVGVWILAAMIVLRRAGFPILLLRPGFARWGTWILVGLLALGAVMNFASRSNWERFIWGPVALTLAVLCLMIARGEEAG